MVLVCFGIYFRSGAKPRRIKGTNQENKPLPSNQKHCLATTALRSQKQSYSLHAHPAQPIPKLCGKNDAASSRFDAVHQFLTAPTLENLWGDGTLALHALMQPNQPGSLQYASYLSAKQLAPQSREPKPHAAAVALHRSAETRKYAANP